MIEKGRHLNLDADYRYCPVCLHYGVRIVEAEMHFLLVCPLQQSSKGIIPNSVANKLCVLTVIF